MQQIICDFGTWEFLNLRLPLRIFGYGLSLVLGFLTGVWLAQWRARRVGENPDRVVYCGLLALVGGIIGARLAYVIENHQRFFPEYGDASGGLLEIFNVTSGGLIYYGGVALATLLVLAYLRIKRLPARRFLDIIAPSLMVGLAFGRVGCLLNGCCYGATCRADWPLAMRFPMYSEPLLKFDGHDSPYSQSTEGPSPAFAAQLDAKLIEPDPRLIDSAGQLIPPRLLTDEQVRVAEQTRSLPVKPAQALGIANGLLLAGILIAFGRLRAREGQVFALLAILYPVTRFLLEAIRADNSHSLAAGVLTHNQYTSLALILVGVIFWLALRKIPASAGPTLAQRMAGGGGAPLRRPATGRKQSERK